MDIVKNDTLVLAIEAALKLADELELTLPCALLAEALDAVKKPPQDLKER